MVLGYGPEVTYTGMKYVVTTNVACHLWFRWTERPPYKYFFFDEKRGFPICKGAKMYMTNYYDQEQEEAGDTTTHTFYLEPWAGCTYRWYYLWGEVGGELSYSESPLLHYHRTPTPITKYFYPDTHPEVSSVDGYAAFQAPPALLWGSIHAAAGTLAEDGSAVDSVSMSCATNEYYWNTLFRALLLFDTSMIPPYATILEAKLRIRIAVKDITPDWAGFGLVVCESWPASNVALCNADYQALGIEALSNEKGYWYLTVGKYETFVLNELGLTKIIPGGITKLGIREAYHDLINFAPWWKKWATVGMGWKSADSPDPPRLEVVFSLR